MAADHSPSPDPQVSGLRSQVATSLLARFRSDRKHVPLHPLERAVLTVVALHLCFLPWALGTMHAWSQLTSLGFSLLGLGLALISRTYSGDYVPGGWPGQTPGSPQPETVIMPVAGHQSPVNGPSSSVHRSPSSVHRPPSSGFRLTMWPRLLRFPLFWIGLPLLAYIAVQGLNPSWVWERNATTWWLRRVNDISWLPTSIDTPFERFNLWRQFIIYASAWLTVCTVWIGFTRRRSLELLLTVLALNAVALAAVGLGRKLTMPEWNPEFRMPSYNFVLWLDKPLPGAYSFASFVYKNHAGAYLALLAGVALTLAAWKHERGVRHLARSTPAFLWLLAVITLAFAVFFTYSRGATLVFFGYLLAAGITYGVSRIFSANRSTTQPAVWLLVVGMLVAVVGFGASRLNYRIAMTTFTSLFENQERDFSIAHRLDAYQAGGSMLADYWQRGLGAGGFRFLFPEYIKHYPESYKNGQLFWEHAHSDWLQYPIELGACGSGLLLLAVVWGLAALKRQKAWRDPAILVLCLAACQTLCHAWFDFPLQNPAILVTWCALMILAIRWAELEAPR